MSKSLKKAKLELFFCVKFIFVLCSLEFDYTYTSFASWGSLVIVLMLVVERVINVAVGRKLGVDCRIFSIEKDL